VTALEETTEESFELPSLQEVSSGHFFSYSTWKGCFGQILGNGRKRALSHNNALLLLSKYHGLI